MNLEIVNIPPADGDDWGILYDCFNHISYMYVYIYIYVYIKYIHIYIYTYTPWIQTLSEKLGVQP